VVRTEIVAGYWHRTLNANCQYSVHFNDVNIWQDKFSITQADISLSKLIFNSVLQAYIFQQTLQIILALGSNFRGLLAQKILTVGVIWSTMRIRYSSSWNVILDFIWVWGNTEHIDMDVCSENIRFKSRIIVRLCHDPLPPNPFQFSIITVSFCPLTLCSLGTESINI
jgi:hypothetical protein